MPIVKSNLKETISFRYDGQTLIEITPDGVSVPQFITDTLVERLGNNISVIESDKTEDSVETEVEKTEEVTTSEEKTIDTSAETVASESTEEITNEEEVTPEVEKTEEVTTSEEVAPKSKSKGKGK